MTEGRLVAVTGTGTEVGKTHVAVALIRELRGAGWRVAARKVAQSFGPEDLQLTDATRLGEASGEAPELVCPGRRSYPLALAPPMAAEALQLEPFRLDDVIGELRASWSSGDQPDLVLVEGAGGLASPQAADGDMADLIRALAPQLVVLVSDPGLGTINLVRLSAAFLGSGVPLVVHLNRFEAGLEAHRRNRLWLREREGISVTTEIGELAARVLRSGPPEELE